MKTLHLRATAPWLLVGCLMLIQTAKAEVLELEGMVKAVDASARTISVERTTSKGKKTLQVEVAKSVPNLRHVRPGAGVSFDYDPGLELVTKLTITTNPPMPLSELVERFKVFDPPAADLKPEARYGVGIDQGFVMGYMTAVAEHSGHRFKGDFKTWRDALSKHLADHPEEGPLPAHVVMVRVLPASESAK
jgi:hypothetical protein